MRAPRLSRRTLMSSALVLGAASCTRRRPSTTSPAIAQPPASIEGYQHVLLGTTEAVCTDLCRGVRIAPGLAVQGEEVTRDCDDVEAWLRASGLSIR